MRLRLYVNHLFFVWLKFFECCRGERQTNFDGVYRMANASAPQCDAWQMSKGLYAC